MKSKTIFICDFRSEPVETECREGIWSEGKSCKECYVDCYRAGWTQRKVLKDNDKRVKEHLLSLKQNEKRKT